MTWTIQQTKFAVKNEAFGLTGDEFDSVEEARDHCRAPGDTVVEMHHGVMEGNVVHTHATRNRPSWTQYTSMIDAANHRGVTADELDISSEMTGLAIVEIAPHDDILVPDQLTGREHAHAETSPAPASDSKSGRPGAATRR